MAGLNHQACGVLDLASAARCPDRALLSKHSNQNEKPDLGQESDAHDRDRKEHVARRERVHECLASCEAPGSKSFRPEKVSVPNAEGARCARRRHPRRPKAKSGHFRTWARAVARSTLPRRADITSVTLPQDIKCRACNRRFVPLASGTRIALVLLGTGRAAPQPVRLPSQPYAQDPRFNPGIAASSVVRSEKAARLS
jgi:hypothetical protein